MRPVRGWTPQTTPVPTSSTTVALGPGTGIEDSVGGQQADAEGMRPVRGWHPQTNPNPTGCNSAAGPGVGTVGFQADEGEMPPDSSAISGGMRPVRGWTPQPAPVDGRQTWQSRGATVLRIGSYA